MASGVTFQILCATEFDKYRDDADPRTKGAKPRTERRCVVVLSGRCADGRSVAVALEGFRPSLKVRADDHAALSAVRPPSDTDPEIEETTTALREFKGYRRDHSAFVRFSFASNMRFMSARKRLRDDKITVYDAALPASMQMLTTLDLSPCGWVTIEPEGPVLAASAVRKNTPAVDLRFAARWRNVRACVDAPAAVAPFRVMAFDIECHSSHGEFPRAKKDYARTARELAEMPRSRLADADQIEQDLMAAFDSGPGTGTGGADSGALSRIYSKGAPTRETVRARAVAIATEFAAAPKRTGDGRGDGGRTVTQALGAHRKTTQRGQADRVSVEKRALAALQAGPRRFPAVCGDPVIQIGASVRVLGEGADTDTSAIFVLGDCDPVDGATVRTFSSERDLLRAFFVYVREASPDFVTGYNVFGFDCAFMAARARELDLDLEALAGTTGDPALFDAHGIAATLLDGTGWTADVRGELVATRGSADREDTYFSIGGRVAFDLMAVVQKGHSLTSYRLDAVARHFTGECKDDVTPAQIFASHTGTAADRAEVARYCIQDCRLVLHLADKLNTVPNALGMADVCGVPVGWIFLRGQGVKILSLVARQCVRDGFALPALGRPDVAVTYEGATVLDPDVGAYIDTPVAVLDFASLYPSSMISHNISHDTFVGGSFGGGTPKTARVETCVPLVFDMSVANRDPTTGEATEPVLQSGSASVAFVTSAVREGVVPRILKRLLAERKRVRGQIKGESDAFRRSTLDGLQLAYKVTANSLYGQLGAPTSPVFMPELAAATTAVGRQMLLRLREFSEKHAGARVIYGDTDSCFMVFDAACAAAEAQTPTARIAATIAAAEACSSAFRAHIPAPHDAEYEKCFSPFLLMSKKRYAGNLYEKADDAPKRASMGIVLRRRDNADIVKRVYGGVLDRVMDRDVPGATEYAREELVRLVRGEVDVAELTITKTLRAPSAYVDPNKIAHVVLAQRMNAREPGSAPNVGERIPYVHIVAPKGTLQGDRIEHPAYLRGGSRIDFAHYLTNQLMKPLGQMFAVLIESVPGARTTRRSDPKQIDADVRRIVFAAAINAVPVAQGGFRDIASFFTRSGAVRGT